MLTRQAKVTRLLPLSFNLNFFSYFYEGLGFVPALLSVFLKEPHMLTLCLTHTFFSHLGCLKCLYHGPFSTTLLKYISHGPLSPHQHLFLFLYNSPLLHEIITIKEYACTCLYTLYFFIVFHPPLVVDVIREEAMSTLLNKCIYN